MISKGPGAQYRRGHSFWRIHKSADVGSWMRSRNHMLDPSLTGFDPGCVKSRESATIPPFPDGGYGWDASLKARIDPS